MNGPVKAITLWQPWASLIALGAKTIETRSWSTAYRGPLVIHAAARKPEVGVSKAVSGWGIGWHRITFPDHVDEGYALARLGENVARPMPLGAIVATCNLVDVVPMLAKTPAQGGSWVRSDDIGLLLINSAMNPGLATDVTAQAPYGDFTPGRFAWLLDDIKPTTERCPACWGTGDWEQESLLTGEPIDVDVRMPCERCDGDGWCDPIPAKGRQQLWNWTPAA